MAKFIERHTQPGENLFFFLTDPSLSLKGKGLLSQIFIFGYQDFNEIEQFNSEGSTAKANVLQELEMAGYLQRERKRAGAQFGDMIYRFFSNPIRKDGKQ